MGCDCALLRIEMKRQFAAVMQQLHFLERQNCVYFNGLRTKIVNLDRNKKSKPVQENEIFSVIGTKSLADSEANESRTESSITPQTSSKTLLHSSYMPQSASNNHGPNITETTSRNGQPSEVWRSSQTVEPSNRININLDNQLTAVTSAEPFMEPKLEEPDEFISGTNPSALEISECKQTVGLRMEPTRQRKVFHRSMFSGGTKKRVLGRPHIHATSRLSKFAAGNGINKNRVCKATVPIKSVSPKSGRLIPVTASSKRVVRADQDYAPSNIVIPSGGKNQFCITVSQHHAAHTTNALSTAHQSGSELYFGSDNLKLKSTEGVKIPLARVIGVGVKKPNNMVVREGNPNRPLLKGMASKRRDGADRCAGPEQPTTSSLTLTIKKRQNLDFDNESSKKSTNNSTARKCIQKSDCEVERSEEVKPFKCNICLKKYGKMMRAIRCRQSHRVEYKCNICRYTTIRAWDYNSHLKLHL